MWLAHNFQNPLRKMSNMEMQEQSLEIHEIDNEQQDYRGPITRSKAKNPRTHRNFNGRKP